MIAARQIAFGRGAGSRGPTAKDYIQDGLVAMWDGIENAGWGTHDPSATVWKDLVNGVELQLCPQASFSDNALVISATEEDVSTAYITIPNATMVPIIVAAMGSGRTPYQCTVQTSFIASNAVMNGGVIVFDSNGGGGGVGINNGNIQYAYSAAPVKVKVGEVGDDLTVTHAFTLDVGESAEEITNNRIYCNGTEFIDANHTFPSTDYRYGRVLTRPCGVAASTFNGFINCDKYMPNNKGGICLDSTMRQIRIYSRALTAEEIAHNYSIDKARFGL